MCWKIVWLGEKGKQMENGKLRVGAAAAATSRLTAYCSAYCLLLMLVMG